MTRDEAKALLMDIVAIYPKFQTANGTIDAWTSRLMAMTSERGQQLLDKWLAGEKGDFPPTLSYFVNGAAEVKIKYAKSDEPVTYHISKVGDLVDQEGREYGNPYTDKPYYYDEMGRICNGLGQVVQP